MSALVFKVVIAGLAASVSPVAVVVLTSVMMKQRARRNSLMFLLGFAVVLLAIGVVIVFVVDAGGTVIKGGRVEGYVDIVLGALCLAAVPLSLRSGKKEEEPGAEGEREMKARRAFLLGVSTMMVNASTIVIYVSGAHEINRAGVGAIDSTAALCLLTVVTLLTLLVPIAILYVFPSRAEALPVSIQKWLAVHRKAIGAAVLLLFAVYLLAKGIRVLA